MSILSTNKRMIKVGQDYSAGENIGIYDHTISSRNWSPDITYASESAYSRSTAYTNDWIEGQYANDLTATNERITNLSGDVSAEVSQLKGDIDELSGDVAYISGVALTAHQSLDGYLTKASGDEYYQPIGSYATLTQLEHTSGEIVNLIPTDFVTNETLEQTSGNIVNLIPDTSDFITNASAEATYQPIGNYATQDWVTSQGYITGVDLSNYYTKNETSGADELANAFSQIGPGGDEEVNELVHSNSANWNDVSSKLDTTSFSDVSGTFLTAHQSLDGYATQDWVTSQGYITGVDLSEYAERAFVLSSIESATSGKLDVSSYASVSSDFLTNEDLNGYATEQFVENVSGDITALIPSDYATTTQINELSGAIDYVSGQVDNKLDTTAFSDVSGSFLTAVDLSNYYTKSETSGASEIADALSNIPTGNPEVENYVQSNSAQIDETVTSFQTNSSTYMVEPNLEYNAVGEISGYGNSAIAQYGAEKQWLVHDDTIVSISNSAQYAFGCNISALQRLMGIDETVLYSGGNTTAADISEPLTAFNSVEIYYYFNDGFIISRKYGTNADLANLPIDATTLTGTTYYSKYGRYSANDTTVIKVYAYDMNNFGVPGTNSDVVKINKIVGIGRKS